MKKLLLATIVGTFFLGNVQATNTDTFSKVSSTISALSSYIYPTVKTGIGALLVVLSPAEKGYMHYPAGNLRESLLHFVIGLELIRQGGKDIISLRQQGDKKRLSNLEIKLEGMFLKLFYPLS